MTENARILLVDDDQIIRGLLMRMLRDKYICDQAAHVPSARQCLVANHYDALITDILMQGESGVELIRFARQQDPTMAVMVVSGVSRQESAREILDADVYGYIVKPFNQNQLLITLDNALRRCKLENRQRLDQQALEREVAAKTADLEKSHRQVASLMSGITSILIGLSPDLRVVQWNAAAETVLGISGPDALGAEFWELELSWDRPRMRQGVEQCLRTGNLIDLDHLRFQRVNGKDGFLGMRISAVDCNGPGCAGVLIMGADITDRILLESQLTQAQKLESIGQLAAGIAHEINTPTQYVGDNVRFFQEAFDDFRQVIDAFQILLQHARQLDPVHPSVRQTEQCLVDADLEYLDEEVPKAIEQTLEGVQRISSIVRSMKEFSHPGSDEMTPVDINKALTSTYTVARNEWKYVAELQTDFDPNLPLVTCFPGELNQVFLNIIINAAHAIEAVLPKNGDQKGAIRIATCARGDHVEVRISDTGCGIPDDIRHRIFDPFFTTKEVGKGTGQGLAIAHRVITEKHDGSLHVETRPGSGTTFIINLPVGEIT